MLRTWILLFVVCQILPATPRPSAKNILKRECPRNQAPIAATTDGPKKVDGHNNVTYCCVPREEQLFEVEDLEIAPSPIETNRMFFIWLQGHIRPEKVDLEALAETSLRIEMSSVPDEGGEKGDDQLPDFPLKTMRLSDDGFFTIRNGSGDITESLNHGRNDVLSYCWIPAVFVDSGLYTFLIEGVLKDDDRRLFGFNITQRLEGEDWW